MMKIKDSTIISILIFTWLMVTVVVLGTEAEMDRLERQIAELSSSHASLEQDVKELRQVNESQDHRMDALEHHDIVQDSRLDAHDERLGNLNDLFKDMLDDMSELEEKIDAMPKNALGLDLSEKDIRNIASLVYLEAGSDSCSYELQKAIASVIFNRMIKYHKTATQVIYQQGVFSPASRVARTIPSARCLRAVREVMENGLTLPSNVVAFQLYGYHSFGHPYCKIDNVYFTAI